MNYDSSYYTNQTGKFDFLMMQQSIKNKKIEKTLSSKNNSNRFKSDKYDDYSPLMMQSSPSKLKTEPIMMINTGGVGGGTGHMENEHAGLIKPANTSAFQASSNSSASSTSSALSSCSLSSSPQQNNLMLINNEQLYISSPSEASSPPVSSVSSVSSNKHHGGVDDGHYNQCQSGNDGYLDSSMSDDMDITGNYSQVPCMGGEMGAMNNMSSMSSRANRFFPDDVVDILNRWFSENQDYPYPDEHMTNVLAREANISAKQVRKWFANKRVRSNKCYKQNYKIKKEKTNSRKQSKSVSDCDGLLNMKDENRLYSDNEEIDDCFGQDNIRPYGGDLMNGGDHQNHLASDCEIGLTDINMAKSNLKHKNKRFSCDFTSIPASYAYNKYSNPSSSSSSFTSSSPISYFDYNCGSNNASANFNNGSPLLSSNSAFGGNELHDSHFSFVPNNAAQNGAPKTTPIQQQQQQQQHMFRSNSAHTAQELLYGLWKNVIDQNPSLAGTLIQNSLQSAHQQSQTIPNNLNLLQNIDNNVVNRLNMAANASSANSTAANSAPNAVNKPDASLSCNNEMNPNSTSAAANNTNQPPQSAQQPAAGANPLPTASSVTAMAAALCNQYYLMNLLQNPLAMQAAFTNRLLMLNNNAAAASAVAAAAAAANAKNGSSESPCSTPSQSDVKPELDSPKLLKSNVTNNNKRKSQLTKCFYNDTAASPDHTASSNKLNRKTPLNSVQKNPLACGAGVKPESESSMPKASQLLVLASALSLHQQQQQQQQLALKSSPDGSSSIRRNKINFGVISDLIN